MSSEKEKHLCKHGKGDPLKEERNREDVSFME